MNFDNKGTAIYLQIAERIMDEISNGTYPPEARIPSVREYAATVEVNANTVMRSFDFLVREEIIYNRRGIGFLVCSEAQAKIIEMRKRHFFDNEMSRTFALLKSIGVSPDELRNLYQTFLTNSTSTQQ